jgi:hypothetical protein
MNRGNAENQLSIPLAIFPNRIFGSDGNSIFDFVRNYHTVFIVAAAFYIPNGSAHGVQFDSSSILSTF